MLRVRFCHLRSCSFQSTIVRPVSDQPTTRQQWSDVNYVKDYLSRLQNHYQIKNDEWHKLTRKQIVDYKGAGLLRRYKSIDDAVRVAYPSAETKKDAQSDQTEIEAEAADWGDHTFLRGYLQRLKEHYQIKENNWGSITPAQVVEFNGSGLLDKYESLLAAVRKAYPEQETKEAENKTRKNWKDVEQLREFLTQLREHYKIAENDWHLITTDNINEFGGSGIFSRYKSFLAAVRVAFPEAEIKSRKKPKQNWQDLDFLRDYLVKLKENYKITDDKWHHITVEQVLKFNGSGLLKQYRTLQAALRVVYPDLPVRSRIVIPKKSWREMAQWGVRENVVNMIESIARAVGITRLGEWNHVNDVLLCQYGAGPALQYHKSKYAMLCFAYPEFEFETSFRKPKGFWFNSTNVVNFLKKMENELSIKQPKDWQRSIPQLNTKITPGVIAGGNKRLINLLQSSYPEVEWDENMLSLVNKKSELFFIVSLLQVVYPDVEVVENYVHPELTLPSGQPVEFDLFIPSKNEAIDYQDEHYFQNVSAELMDAYEQKEEEKKQFCATHGIHLIYIPFWWSRTADNLRDYLEDE